MELGLEVLAPGFTDAWLAGWVHANFGHPAFAESTVQPGGQFALVPQLVDEEPGWWVGPRQICDEKRNKCIN